MSRLFEALRDTADGAFVTDEKLRIAYWNESAGEILGFDRGEVVGQFCYQVLHGHDEKGRLLCKARCQVADSILKAEPIPSYDILASTNQGDRCWLKMSVFPYRMGENGDKKRIVHLFRDINQKKDYERFFWRLVEASRRHHGVQPENEIKSTVSPDILTSREHEILTLLAQGHGTRDIAQMLSISSNAVRNHVQNILGKLHVHTRLEAVIYAVKHGLIDY